MNMLYKVKRCIYCNNANITLEEYELCDNCDDIIMKKIREELSNGTKTPKELASNIGIPLKLINAYMKDDRLIDLKEENNFHTCKYCGEAINEGDICMSCLNKLKLKAMMMEGKSEAQKTLEPTKPKTGTVMHVYKR